METILLNNSDPEKQVCRRLLCWNPEEFSDIIQERLGIYGWRVHSQSHSVYITAPEGWFIEVYRSEEKFRYDQSLFNPFYKIFFRNLCVCIVRTEVGRYSTSYTLSWNEDHLEQARSIIEKEKA